MEHTTHEMKAAIETEYLKAEAARDELTTAGGISLLRESLDALDRELANLFDRIGPALLPEDTGVPVEGGIPVEPPMSPVTYELVGIRRQVENLCSAVARTRRRVSL